MTRDEVVAKVREHFARMDADTDGSITDRRDEADARRAPARCGSCQRRRARRAHACGMSARSQRGVRPARRQQGRHRSAATNSPRAARSGSSARRVRERRRRPGDAGQRAGCACTACGGMAEWAAAMIAMADTDKDGRDHAGRKPRRMALQHFDQMDANRDGQVTPEERRAGRPMMSRSRRRRPATAG